VSDLEGSGDIVRAAPHRYPTTAVPRYPTTALPEASWRVRLAASATLVAVLIIAGMLNEVLLMIVTLLSLAALAARAVRRFVRRA
jgi:hypothetical protein